MVLDRRYLLVILFAAIFVVGAGVAEASPEASDPGVTVYIVQPGDTLFSIARRHGTTVAAIAQANGILDPTVIYAGQRLVLPASDSKQVAALSDRYTVQPGDTLFSIAARHGTTVAAIAQANNILNPSIIFVGQTLTIPAIGIAPPPMPPAELIEYVVQPGDNLTGIAVRFGTTSYSIALTNNLANPSLIYAGQRLVIPSTGQIVTPPPPSPPEPVLVTPPPTQITLEKPPVESDLPPELAELIARKASERPVSLEAPPEACCPPEAEGSEEVPSVASEPTELQWKARVTSNTSGEVPTLEVRSVIRISVVGKPGLRVVISSGDTFQAANITGTKPEYGEFACEFAPLSANTYTVTPQGLDQDVSIDVTMDGVGIAYVEFAQR